MRLIALLLILQGLNPSSWATLEPHLRTGDQVAHELLGKVDAHKKKAEEHPFYQGSPSESSLKGIPSPAAQMVLETSSSRPKFKIDPEKDPLLKVAEAVIKNPLPLIGGAGTESVQVTQGGKDAIVTCEESGEEADYTCLSTLQVEMREELGPPQQGALTIPGGSYGALAGLLEWPRVRKRHFVAHVIQSPPALRSFISRTQGIPLERVLAVSIAQTGGWHKISRKTYVFGAYHFTYQYRPLIKVPIFSWKEGCEGLEARADQAECSYVSKVCSQGPGTRVIDGVSVTRDCWEYTYTYSCTHPSQNNCGPLRARGCVQVKSDCKQQIGKACVVYTQTYQCKGDPSTTTEIRGGHTPFCLDGHCRDQSFEANDELMPSLAQLSLLKDMQGVFDGMLFKGTDNRCSKATLSFKDCCGSGRGWGVKLGLAGCHADEKALQIKRQKGLCHFIGTYCSKREKLTKICLQKKSTYCCFGSKLLRTFHEQGRAQIGMNWGSADAPLCRGFTVEELQRIDFSKLDLHEVFEDLMKSYQPAKLKHVNKKLKERLEIIKGSVSPKPGTPQKQRKEA